MNELKDYENELVDSLRGCSVPAIAEKFSDCQIFCEKIKNIFSTLDYDHLDSTLCVRYLVQEIMSSLSTVYDEREKQSKWNSFLAILCGLGERAKALNRKLSGKKDELSNLSHEEYKATFFKESDISKLLEVLSECAYKWEKLSLALNLPQNVIEECRCGSSLVIRISKVLRSWIIDHIPQAKPATLENLILVLSGRILNCTNAVDALKEKFYKESKADTCKLSNSFINVHPVHTSVKYGSSALLGVKVHTSKPVSYKWQKNGKQVHHSSNCNGVHDSILCVPKVTDSGRYSCLVKIEGETVETNEAVLDIILPPKDQYLSDKYSIFDEVPRDSWPPVSTGAFIKLALIMGQEEAPMRTIKHNIDDILKSKELVDYSEVFGTYNSGLVLVEGRPGSGKTTLVTKVVRDWAKSLRTLRGATMVYLISLRMLNMTEHEELFDILRPFYIDNEDARVALNNVKHSNGKGVCFILDGLDEYTRNNEKTIIHDLIYQNILPHAMVIVASRPVGTAIHRGKAKVAKRVEVLGFTEVSIHKYINSYPFPIPETASNLIKYLNIQINVLHMCYLPIHASMVCYLYMKLGDNIPNTETKLYELFTSQTLVRKIKRDDDNNSEFKSLDSMTGNLKEDFIKICKLAFEMISRSVQAISTSDFDAQLSHRPGSDDPFLGLVVVDAIADLLGYKEMYTFLHLTYQEFLAAWYVSKLSESRQYHIIKLLCQKEQHQVLKFYFGLVDIRECTDQFQHMFQHIICSDSRVLHCLQCAFESHTELACDIISKYIFHNLQDGNKLYISNCSIMPLDFTAIGYVMSNCFRHLSRIEMEECVFNVEGIQAFISTVNPYEICFIKHLDVSFLGIPFPVQALNLLLYKVHYLEYFNIGSTVLDDETIRAITKGVTLINLKVLSVQVCISQSDVAELLKFGSENFCLLYAGSTLCHSSDYRTVSDFTWSHLCHNFKMHVVPYSREAEYFVLCCLNFNLIQFDKFLHCIRYNFIDCDIDDRAIAIIVMTLTRGQKPTKLESLVFDLNSITTMGALFLAYLLEWSPIMENLSLFGNNIDSIGAEAIAQSLKNCKYLRRLDLQCNNIGDDGAMAIAKATTQRNLELNLWNHNITENVMQEVMKYKTEDYCSIKTICFSHVAQYVQKYPQIFDKLLKVCYNVREFNAMDTLKSNHTQITNSDDFISELCKKLKYFRNVVHLNMEECHIGPSRAHYLVEALQCLHQLKILNLSLNSLCSPGTITVANGLKYCPQLEVLNMSGNAFSSPKSIFALADGLKQLSSLTELDLSNNGLFSMAGEILAVKFLKLCKLNLSYCNINSSGASSLAEHMNNCPSLQSLSLSGNNLCNGLVDVANTFRCYDLQVLKLYSVIIDLNSANALSRNLEHCMNLVELYLVDNDMDRATTEVLADGLKFCKNLRILYVCDNTISPRAAARLARCLQHGNMQNLFLSGCDIDSKGCINLAVELRNCKKLKTLRLRSNEIGSEGATALTNEIKSLNLELIDVSHNPIDDTSGIYMMEQLKHIEYIFMSDSNFTEKTKRKIQKIKSEIIS